MNNCIQFFRVGQTVYAYTPKGGGVDIKYAIGNLAGHVFEQLAAADKDAPLWHVSIGTININAVPSPQFSLWCGEKAYRSASAGVHDKPGRRRFTGSLEEAWEFIEPYVRLL